MSSVNFGTLAGETGTPGGGTVTSVALTAPSALFQSPVSGSPVVSAGTLALALANQSANQFFAGPSSAGPAAPTWRALTNADMPATGAGSGTVTSVALTVPGVLFSVGGSPVTSSGTLALSLLNQSANLVFAGPSTGAATAPTWRALVANDIPSSLNATTFTGLATFASAGTAYANGTKVNDTANGTLQIQNSGGTSGALILGPATTSGYQIAPNGTHLAIRDGAGGLDVLLDAFAFKALTTGVGFAASTSSGPAFANQNAALYGLGWADNTHLNLYTAGTSALSIDSSQNATFSATVKVQSGGTIRSGSGAPAGALGSVGDIYLNTAAAGGTTNFYVKTGASTWTAVA